MSESKIPKNKKEPISDFVWGFATLLAFCFSLYTTHYNFFSGRENIGAGQITAMLFLWLITAFLATQAPDITR